MQALCMKYNLNAIVNYSAKEALETVKQRPNIKLILVDYMMPENGWVRIYYAVTKRL